MKKYSDIWNQPRKLKSDKWEHYKDYHNDISHFIFSIEFFDSIIAIRKKQKLEPLRIQK